MRVNADTAGILEYAEAAGQELMQKQEIIWQKNPTASMFQREPQEFRT